MSKAKFSYAVVLTREAIASIANQPISYALVRDSYFLCSAIDPDGTFLHLTVQHEKNKMLPTNVEGMSLLIPHHYVLYILSFPPERNPGFQISQITPKPENESAH